MAQAYTIPEWSRRPQVAPLPGNLHCLEIYERHFEPLRRREEPVREFAIETYGIFIYLDVVVIEKRPSPRPFHVQMGG